MRLHIGGARRAEGWIVLDARPGPAVDVVADAAALPFGAGVAEEIYASHVYEHLGYWGGLPAALAEARRVLVPGGVLRLSVPDLDALARLYVAEERTPDERFQLMRMIFGGQMDARDFHLVGLSHDTLEPFLRRAGFRAIERVDEHGLFDDASALRFAGRLISLNLVAR
jgi:predicted SAM-dependent methyltransferase